MTAATGARERLNRICPYFTMFPLDFPLGILRRRARRGDRVLDPFCGRGTTSFAARLLGLESLGVDSSPVAAAITAAKLVTTSVADISLEAGRILDERQARQVPAGEFWQWAFHPVVLELLCRLREAFLEDCSASSRVALRGLVLGALHGPRQKGRPSYFSNQCPRTFAPKPDYATRYWRARGLLAEAVDVQAVIAHRAARYYASSLRTVGEVRLADSRQVGALLPSGSGDRFDWVITSPPYYGMRTYTQDQWLRSWFVGGSSEVDYAVREQVAHSSAEDFSRDLRLVWRHSAQACADDARMVIRFGGIRDRAADPLALIEGSLRESGWRIATIREAGTARRGKRQADAFLRTRTEPLIEYDVWAEKRQPSEGGTSGAWRAVPCRDRLAMGTAIKTWTERWPLRPRAERGTASRRSARREGGGEGAR